MPINKLGKHYLNKSYYCVLPIAGTDIREPFYINGIRFGRSYLINYGKKEYQFPLPSATVQDVYIYPPDTIVLVNNEVMTHEDLLKHTFSRGDILMFIRPDQPASINSNCFIEFILSCEQ